MASSRFTAIIYKSKKHCWPNVVQVSRFNMDMNKGVCTCIDNPPQMVSHPSIQKLIPSFNVLIYHWKIPWYDWFILGHLYKFFSYHVHLGSNSKFSFGAFPIGIWGNYTHTTVVHTPRSRCMDERNEQMFIHGHLRVSLGVAWELESRFTFGVAMLLPMPPPTSHITIYNFT